MGVFASVYHVYVVHMDPLESDVYATAWVLWIKPKSSAGQIGALNLCSLSTQIAQTHYLARFDLEL